MRCKQPPQLARFHLRAPHSQGGAPTQAHSCQSQAGPPFNVRREAGHQPRGVRQQSQRSDRIHPRHWGPRSGRVDQHIRGRLQQPQRDHDRQRRIRSGIPVHVRAYEQPNVVDKEHEQRDGRVRGEVGPGQRVASHRSDPQLAARARSPRLPLRLAGLIVVAVEPRRPQCKREKAALCRATLVLADGSLIARPLSPHAGSGALVRPRQDGAL
mmetsp:Transcript_27265/g.87668  ORF Transcript_27265/g.87668 Transcript_27265/m.87668 type:complete len:212 (+) Transcript_27265:217-852(+)